MDRAKIKRLKKYYPKDLMFCLYGDECPIIGCQRKISDLETRLLNYECGWQDFKHTEECHLTNGD